MKYTLPVLFFTLFLFAGCSEECSWGAYEGWDQDESGYLDQGEFYSGINASGGFTRWDVDGSGYLSENEYNTVFGELGGEFDEWDQNEDDQLAENEVYSGLYGLWNENGDDGIYCEEFDAEWAEQYGVAGGTIG